MRRRKRLGDLLLEVGLLSQEQIDEALAWQRQAGLRFGQAVVSLGFVTEGQVADVLAGYWDMPRVALDEIRVEPHILKLIPRDLMERYDVFPLAIEKGVLQVAMVDPQNVHILDDLRRLVGRKIAPRLTTPGEMQRAIARHYDLQATTRDVLARFGTDWADDVAAPEDVSDSVGVRLVNLILDHAVRERASDIHI